MSNRGVITPKVFVQIRITPIIVVCGDRALGGLRGLSKKSQEHSGVA